MAEGSQNFAKLVGRRIRQLRYERGWKQVDLAAELDERVAQVTLSHYETGRILPSMATLLMLAKVFDVPPQLLLLDPENDARHRVAAAALTASKAVLTRLQAQLPE